MANDVASSVRLPISIAPRLRTETERWVAASVPIVRYLINRVSETENALSQTEEPGHRAPEDRKSTRLNSSHMSISYAVFCLKKKKEKERKITYEQINKKKHTNQKIRK